MDGIGLADARAGDALRQQRIVGRVIGGVAEAGEAEHRHHHPEGVRQRDDGETAGAEQQAGHQHQPRADAIDQEPRRRLHHRRDGGECGQRCSVKLTPKSSRTNRNSGGSSRI